MKKTQKNILGFFGLVLVAIVTAFATILPHPIASAAEDSANVNLTVRISSNYPELRFVNFINGTVFTEPDQTFYYYYSKVHIVDFVLRYTDEDGNTAFFYPPSVTITQDHGINPISLYLDDYGYGDYILTAIGTGDSAFVEDSIYFKYIKIPKAVPEVPNTGGLFTKLNLSQSDYLLTGLVAIGSFILITVIYKINRRKK